jgi:hypothetical protein
VIRKSRFVAAIGLVMVMGVSALAHADGIADNTPFVDGSVSPTKLDKKKYKKVELFTGVRTEGAISANGCNSHGTQCNPEAELISFGKNIKIDSTKAPVCDATIENLTTEAAKAACPPDSDLGGGEAQVTLPGGFVSEPITVTAFNGPGKDQLRLHTYSSQLAGATPTVQGFIVKSAAGSQYGQALNVPDAPDVADDTGKITKFNATIEKGSGVVTARCKAKTFLWQRIVTYDDGSKETAELSQPCKRKKSNK